MEIMYHHKVNSVLINNYVLRANLEKNSFYRIRLPVLLKLPVSIPEVFWSGLLIHDMLTKERFNYLIILT
jgi:hypothetical protein